MLFFGNVYAKIGKRIVSLPSFNDNSSKNMKIALIGYGKMGHIIEEIALQRGHEIVSVIDIDNQQDFDSQAFLSADVAIEFTRPQTAKDNIVRCLDRHIPVVVGTTGWYDALPQIKELCHTTEGGLFYASNFSIGVNIFMALSKYTAKIMNKFSNYEVGIEETHHIHKLDSPSGTAITLAEGIIDELDRKQRWEETSTPAPDTLGITAIRRDEVPGIHTIRYESDVDSITLTHDAKSRAGFAWGAVVAAEFLCGKKGVYTMTDLLKF